MLGKRVKKVMESNRGLEWRNWFKEVIEAHFFRLHIYPIWSLEYFTNNFILEVVSSDMQNVIQPEFRTFMVNAW